MKASKPSTRSTLEAVRGMAILGCALLAGTPLSAGVVLQLKTTDYSTSPPRVESSELSVEGSLLKMDLEAATGDGLNHTMIFKHGDPGQILVVNHRRKTFQVMDPSTIATLGSEMRRAMSEVLQEVESLPPEQRELVKRMLDTQLKTARERPEAPPSTVLKTNERAVHQGFECTKYDVFRLGDKIREVWVTPTSAAPGGEEALAALRDMSDFYSELMASFEKLAATGFGGGFSLDQHPFDELQHMDGFPVLTRNYENGSLSTEMALQSVREQKLEPTEFEPPTDYHQTAMGPR